MSENLPEQAEFGSRPEDVSQFNGMMTALAEHNKQFSLGAVMARTMIGMVNESIQADELMQEGASPEEAEQVAAWVNDNEVPLSEEQKIAREVVGLTNADALDAAGLQLTPVRKTVTMIGPNGETEIGSVRLELSDGGKFSGFLAAIKPESINDELKNNVDEVGKGILGELATGIYQGEKNQAVNEALTYARGIAHSLRSIEGEESALATRFEDYATHNDAGDLTEWVAADKIGLLQTDFEKHFGPATWQRDASNEFLAENWSDVIKLLQTTKENPKAQNLFDQLVTKAKSDLEFAEKDWRKLQEHYPKGYGAGFDDIFTTVSIELEDLTSDSE